MIWGALLWLLGCNDTAEPKIELVPALEPDVVMTVGGEASPPQGAPEGLSAASVPVQLKFYNISKLHQGFFTQSKGIAELGKGLAQCTTHTVELHVSYDNDTRQGRIMAVLPPKTSTCEPKADGSGIDLAPMEPVGLALAKYRDYVAGTSDFRISSFVVATSFSHTLSTCELRLAGQHPPDGTTWSPCVRFSGKETCANGSKAEGVRRLDFAEPADGKRFMSCLGQ